MTHPNPSARHPFRAAASAVAVLSLAVIGGPAAARGEDAPAAVPTAEPAPGAAEPPARPGEPLPGSAFADLDENLRFVPTTRPATPVPQRPPPSTDANTDTGKPPAEWQRATDDWGGLRPKLDDRGVSVAAALVVDAAKNLRGGASTDGSSVLGLANLNLTLDTDRLFGLAGGTAFASLQSQFGPSPTGDVGSVVSADNIEAGGRSQLSELWYQQAVAGGRAWVKVGKVDANADFSATGAVRGEFLNAAAAISPTVLGFPTYPDPAAGVVVGVRPTESWYVTAGLFDGATAEGHPTGGRALDTVFGPPGGLFVIGEAGAAWTAGPGRDGHAGVGVWHHTGDFAKFDGGTASGATGPYAFADQRLWRENPAAADDDGQGVAAYAQYGYADPAVSAVAHHVAVGLTWTGLVPTRDDDVLGAAVSWARLSDADGAGFRRDVETAYELFYKVRLTRFASLKPDLQYVRHPGGGRDGDALLATVRFTVDF